MRHILRAKNIFKTFQGPTPVQVLNDVSLLLEEGSSTAIMGRSGEGKTTLLHILGTLEGMDSGKLEIAGKNTEKYGLEKIRNFHIGFIFQTYNLLDHFTALENVLMPAKIARQKTDPSSPAYERALFLLDEVGLLPRAHFHTKLLSGGEKQRVAIARAFCNDPDLILADEPSGNLDHASSRMIHELLISCVKKHLKTLLVVTHDEELASLCDKKYVLQDALIKEKKT